MAVTEDASDAIGMLAAALAASDVPTVVLPAVLPCTPIDLLVALHQLVVSTMLSDPACAQRAATVAWTVVQRFPDDSLLHAQAHWSQASAILYVPNYASALAHYDSALMWYERACQMLAPALPVRDVRVVEIVRVFCLSELGRYAEAQQAATIAEYWLHDHPDTYAQLTLLLNRSQLAGRMGDYIQMVNLADATIALATDLNAIARRAQGWINRAHACIYISRFVDAETALDQGIALAIEAGETLTIARAQYNRARLLRYQGHLFAALTTLRDAQRGMAQAEGEAATIALEQAELYEQLCQLPDAQRVARRAAEQFAQQLMPAYSADAFLHAARIAVQQQNITLAQDLLQHATTQAEQAHVRQIDAEIALVRAELATLPNQRIAPARLARQQRAARTMARKSLALLEASGIAQEAAIGQLTIAMLNAQLGDTREALTIYRGLAHHPTPAIQLTANAGLGALLPPAEGLLYLQHAAALAVEQRRALPMEELQARYSSETSPHHLRLAACYLALGDISRALESVCAAKGGPLLDLRSATAAALEDSQRTMLQGYKADLARWRQEAHDHRRRAQFAVQNQQDEASVYHAQRAEVVETQIKATERALTEAMRTFGDRSGRAEIPNVAALQLALSPKMAVLEYARFGNDLICFLVEADCTPRCRVLGDYRVIAPLLDRWSLVYHRLMNGQASAEAHRQTQAVLRPLWDVLLAPWQETLATSAHVLIAPYGILHHVPWAALEESSARGSSNIPITLTPCSALWAAPALVPNGPIGRPRILGYAGAGDHYLDYVETELTAIAGHLHNVDIRANATAADLQTLPPPRLLHIAAHGLTNPAAPLCSTIELADGPFLLLEAHRLNLRGTQLVVLSACETSVRPDYGDMALALAGAFLCAGAQAVLASLWRVSDRATAVLMERFYAALAGGAPPAVALRQAQRQIQPDYPLDWAAFQLWAGAR